VGFKNVRLPGDTIKAIAACLLPPPPASLSALVTELAKDSNVANTATGIRMLQSILGKCGVPREKIDDVIRQYESLRND
jgi:hypothetical protein